MKLLSDALGWTVLRRLLSLGGLASAALLVLPALPLWLLLVAGIDLMRDTLDRRLGRLPFSRALLLFGSYLLAEVVGVCALALLWLYSGTWLAPAFPALSTRAQRRLHSRSFRLQCLWVSFLFSALRTLYRTHLEVEGDALARPGPLIVFFRHTSVGDVVLPGTLLSARHGLELRYVLKRSLLWDPCVDLVGNRLSNVYVWRSSSHAQREVAAVAELGRNLQEHQGVLIYPEGTRFTEAKRTRVLERLTEQGDTLRRGWQARLRHCLVPRPGGPQALLALCAHENTPPDVLIGAHVGLEAAASVGSVARGALLDRTLWVRFWRFPASEVPKEPGARERWLFERWLEVDAFVQQHLDSRDPDPEAIPA